MRAEQIMLSLIRSEICGEQVNKEIKSELTPEILPGLYVLSKSHDVAQIVASALQNCGALAAGSESLARFQKQQMLAVYRCESLKHELASISSVLEEEKVRFVPLKGAVLRRYYPEEWMRTSCDIDVLVPEEDLERAISSLCQKLGYQCGRKNYHDVSLRSPGGVHLELHFSIQEHTEDIDALLSRVWEFVIPDSPEGYQCHQTPEFFVFYHLAHMSYHFEGGGCGIKPFIDMYIIESKLEYDRELVRSYCRESQIEQFYDGVLELTQVWMEGAEHTQRTRLMEEYVLQGGVYGSLENKISHRSNKENGRRGYLLSRIFLPYDDLKISYPVLEKHKWLTPIMQVRRWFRILFRGGLKRGAKEWSASRSVTDEQEQRVKALMEQLGL